VGEVVGASVGERVGAGVGDVVGASVGLTVGEAVGASVGLTVGEAVGALVGLTVGEVMGASVGEVAGAASVGLTVGGVVGASVGEDVGERVASGSGTTMTISGVPLSVTVSKETDFAIVSVNVAAASESMILVFAVEDCAVFCVRTWLSITKPLPVPPINRRRPSHAAGVTLTTEMNWSDTPVISDRALA
jgi:hypothetical protein